MDTKQTTILESLEILLSKQVEWYKDTTLQLVELEKGIDFYRDTLNLKGERVGDEINKEVSKSPQTVADHTEFLLDNFRIISTAVFQKLVLLNEDLSSANKRLVGIPIKEETAP